MARWQRDPRARQRLAYVIAAAEAVALAINFYLVFSAYLRWVNIRLGTSQEEPLISWSAAMYVAVALTAVCLGVAVGVGLKFAKGLPWARLAFVVANGVLVAMGLLWFAKNRAGSVTPDPMAALGGLLVPMVTLFPLLWPLLTFRAVTSPGEGGRGG